jgi:hypothetical protein
MEVQTVPTAPSTPVLSAPTPAQVTPAKATPAPSTVQAGSVQAAPPAPTASPTPPCTVPSAPPAQPVQTPAPPPKPTVPAPPAPPTQPAQAAPTAKATSAQARTEGTTVSPTAGDDTAGESDASEEEDVVTRQIVSLWADREKKKTSLIKTKTSLNTSKASLKTTKEQLSLMRAELGKRLFELKNLLAKPGRKGRWASFLDGEGIPRATADRYAQFHKRSLEGKTGKRLSEAISIPTEEEIKKMVVRLTPRLVRVLPTQETIAQFLHEMTEALQPSGSAE